MPKNLFKFYRTAAGAEIDLVLKILGKNLWAVEIKRGLAPKRSFVGYSGADRFPIGHGIEVIGLIELASIVAHL